MRWASLHAKTAHRVCLLTPQAPSSVSSVQPISSPPRRARPVASCVIWALRPVSDPALVRLVLRAGLTPTRAVAVRTARRVVSPARIEHCASCVRPALSTPRWLGCVRPVLQVRWPSMPVRLHAQTAILAPSPMGLAPNVRTARLARSMPPQVAAVGLVQPINLRPILAAWPASCVRWAPGPMPRRPPVRNWVR